MSETSRARATRATEREPEQISAGLLAQIVEATTERLSKRPNPMDLNTFEEIEAFADRVAKSKMVPKDYQGRADDIILAVMKGKELGLPPIQSLESIAMINGRASVWGAMVEAICYASGLVEDHEEHFEGTEGTDDFTAVCTVKRKGIPSPKVGRFSQGDAKRAGLFGQAVHGKYPRRMMQWRAKHPAFTDAFPDVLRGIGMRELDAEDFGSEAPKWSMPQPEKSWFANKKKAAGDDWDNTWFEGLTKNLIQETSAWKWMDLLIEGLDRAPTKRDVQEITDLPMFTKALETAPADAKATIETAVTAALKRFDAKTSPESTPAPADATRETVAGSTATAEVPEVADRQNAASGADAFDGLLLDRNGDPVGQEAYSDPVKYVVALAALLREEPNAWEAIWEQNADGIADARRAASDAARLLEDLEVADDTQQAHEAEGDPGDDAETAPGVICVVLKSDRGKLDDVGYFIAFKTEVAALVKGNFHDFIEMNLAEMKKAKKSTFIQCIKTLERKATELGIEAPANLRKLMAPTANETPTDDADLVSQQNLLSTIQQCDTLGMLDQFNNGAAIKSFADRMTRAEKPHMLESIRNAFMERRSELKRTA